MFRNLLHSFDKQTILQLLPFLSSEQVALLSCCCHYFDRLLGPLKEWAFEQMYDTEGNLKPKALGAKRASISRYPNESCDRKTVCWDVCSEIHTLIVGGAPLFSSRKTVICLSAGLRELYWSEGWPLPLLPLTLTKLVVARRFCDPLPRLHEGLIHLSIDQQFWNFPLDHLPTTLQFLQVGYHEFNQPLSNLPSGLLHLRIKSRAYSHKIESWPPNLLSLQLQNSYKHAIDQLPNSLTKLECYSLPTLLPDSLLSLKLMSRDLPKCLPPNLTRLKFPYGSVADYQEWPQNLTSLRTQGEVCSVKNLPRGLRVFSVWTLQEDLKPMLSNLTLLDLMYMKPGFSFPLIDLPHTLLHLSLPASFNSALILPCRLQTLTLGWDDQPFSEMPDSLTKLQIIGKFNHPLVLPSNLLELQIVGGFNQPLELPASLTKLELGDRFTHALNLPPSLVSLFLGHSFKHPLLELPPSLKMCHLTECNLTYEKCKEARPYYFSSCGRYDPCQEAKETKPENHNNSASSSPSSSSSSSSSASSCSSISSASSATPVPLCSSPPS